MCIHCNCARPPRPRRSSAQPAALLSLSLSPALRVGEGSSMLAMTKMSRDLGAMSRLSCSALPARTAWQAPPWEVRGAGLGACARSQTRLTMTKMSQGLVDADLFRGPCWPSPLREDMIHEPRVAKQLMLLS
ncbi:unnamed protein product [Prorocentrum cordatum]|uniref:Uncharacterized protein n=1 Tax=Prorocentrum cordatum TaxID=2364126 RepID=A0ABN9Y019_9DINO|nr:unnamed protein product [Polarella glacialis]